MSRPPEPNKSSLFFRFLKRVRHRSSSHREWPTYDSPPTVRHSTGSHRSWTRESASPRRHTAFQEIKHSNSPRSPRRRSTFRVFRRSPSTSPPHTSPRRVSTDCVRNSSGHRRRSPIVRFGCWLNMTDSPDLRQSVQQDGGLKDRHQKSRESYTSTYSSSLYPPQSSSERRRSEGQYQHLGAEHLGPELYSLTPRQQSNQISFEHSSDGQLSQSSRQLGEILENTELSPSEDINQYFVNFNGREDSKGVGHSRSFRTTTSAISHARSPQIPNSPPGDSGDQRTPFRPRMKQLDLSLLDRIGTSAEVMNGVLSDEIPLEEVQPIKEDPSNGTTKHPIWHQLSSGALSLLPMSPRSSRKQKRSKEEKQEDRREERKREGRDQQACRIGSYEKGINSTPEHQVLTTLFDSVGNSMMPTDAPLICQLGNGKYSRRVFIIRSPTQLDENIILSDFAQTRMSDVRRFFSSQPLSSERPSPTMSNQLEPFSSVEEISSSKKGNRSPSVYRMINLPKSNIKGNGSALSQLWPKFLLWDLPISRSIISPEIKAEFRDQVGLIILRLFLISAIPSVVRFI